MSATVVLLLEESVVPPHRSIRAGWFTIPAIFLVLLIPHLCLAQVPLDADTQEISRYVLTEQGLAKFQQATTNLRDVEDWLESSCEDHGDVNSLDEAEARIERHPGAETDKICVGSGMGAG